MFEMSVVVRCENCKRIVEKNPICYRCDGELYLVDSSKKSGVTFCKECRRACHIDDCKMSCSDCGNSLLFFISKDLTNQ